MHVFTVQFGGDWSYIGDTCTYVGDVTSKPFVLDDKLQIEDLKLQIIERFKIQMSPRNIVLSHMHPLQKWSIPYKVDDIGDLSCFIAINETPDVSWTLPLCVTFDTNLEIQPIQSVAEDLSLSSSIEQQFYWDDAMLLSSTMDEQYSDEDTQRCNQVAIEHSKDFLHIGQSFKTKEELKIVIQKQAFKENFGYKVYKSTKSVYELKCVDEKCKWRMRAIILRGTRNFEIKKYYDAHSCSFNMRCEKSCQPTYKAIGEHIMSRYATGVKKGPDPKSIQNDMREEFSVHISYWKAWKSKEWAQNLIRGSPEANYRQLPSYLEMLRKTNPGTYTNFVVDEDNRFKYAFIAIGASIRGFDYVRKVIMVDGTHLHAKYEGNLMIATAQDGNNQIYPLAFGIVDSENDDSWTWFFAQLQKIIPDAADLVFVSDRHKSIAKGIQKIYNPENHLVCTRHLKENLKTYFKKKRSHALFTQASECYTMMEFRDYFQQICNMDWKMGDYLLKANIEKWARSQFKGDRYNIMTSNNAESINSILKEARGFQVIALLEHIRRLLADWFFKRRELIEKTMEEMPPHVSKVVEERYKRSKKYEARQLNKIQFEVIGGNFCGIVDLFKKTCSCRVFDLDKIPCVHAMAAIQKVNGKMTDFIGKYYLFSSWRDTYKESIYPVPMRSQWDVPKEISSIACYPPYVRKNVGRPRKKRILSIGERKLTVSKKPTKEKSCSACGNIGHNKTTCKYQKRD